MPIDLDKKPLMSNSKPNVAQLGVMVACLAVFVTLALVIKTWLGFSDVMSGAVFGAVGGGIGGAIGQVLARSFFKNEQ